MSNGERRDQTKCSNKGQFETWDAKGRRQLGSRMKAREDKVKGEVDEVQRRMEELVEKKKERMLVVYITMHRLPPFFDSSPLDFTDSATRAASVKA